MRQNPSFALTDAAEIRRVIRRHPWATLVSDADEGLVASHYPVLLDEGRDDLAVVTHLGRPDDIVHGLGEREIMMVFQGPHGYITPRWYGEAKAVPTWNYVSVHLSGVPEILSTEENLDVLDRLVARFESVADDPRLMWERPNDEAFVRRLEAGTVGIRLVPTRVVAKRKLSQNRPDDVVETIIAGLGGDGAYREPALAAEMRRSQDQRSAARAVRDGALEDRGAE